MTGVRTIPIILIEWAAKLGSAQELVQALSLEDLSLRTEVLEMMVLRPEMLAKTPEPDPGTVDVSVQVLEQVFEAGCRHTATVIYGSMITEDEIQKMFKQYLSAQNSKGGN